MNIQTQEALKMAIEVMYRNSPNIGLTQELEEAINACKEALEQPAQEPVAWYGKDIAFPKSNKIFVFNNKDDADAYGMRKSVLISPLYTYPHQWQGLTDDEILDMYFQANISPQPAKDVIDFIRAIEQSLKDKNT